MPLYEYQCAECGRFELIRKFADDPLTVCPTCGREVQKLPSAPAIQFKGSGWYVTDYARKSSPGEAGGKSDGGNKADGEGKSDGASKSEGDSGAKDKAASSKSASSDATSTTSTSTTKDTSASTSGSSSAK